MPIKSGRRGARRRETQLPPQPMAFVNDDRRRGRRQQQRMVGQLTEESSVIMLSSAENTLMPEGGGPDESSVLMATSVGGERRSGRRSTRLTDVDMMLDETGNSMQSWRSKSIALDGTNMSIINVDQTTMIERERAKSSVLPRWTRSKSLAPAGAAEEDAEGIRRSSIFSMVTKRNRRRARSIVRSSTREEVAVRGNSSPGERNADAGKGADLSQISEEQSNSSAVGSVAGTPKQFVKELVIQTRSMLRKGKRWSPAQAGAKAQPDKPSQVKDGSKNKNGRRGKQKQPNAAVVTEELPVREHGKEAPSNKRTPLVPSVTRRKRKESNLEHRTPEEIPIVDANQNVSFASKGKAQPEQPTGPQKQPETDESIANPATSRLESSFDQSKSAPGDNSQFSNVSKRKRPKPTPDKDPEPPKKSTTPEKNVHEAPTPEPEPATKRAQTRSASRARQPTKEPKKSTENRARTRSVSRPRQATPEPDKSTQTRGRAPRKRAISESAKIAPIEPIMTRHRSKSALRTELPEPQSSSRARSRTRTRTAKPVSPGKAGETPSRSKSVPRGVLLSPPPSTSDANHSTGHVPIYRQYAEHVLQLNRSVLPRPDPIPAPSGEDVYMFDSPSQGSTTTTTTAGDDTKKTKGSTAKKRPRLTSNVSSRSRKTPVKHHTTVFGTDMGKICSVVKKIGGGLVRRTAEDEGTPANRNVVHTSTLAAMVQPLQPSNALNIAPRSPSAAANTHEMATDVDHHEDHEYEDHYDFDEENIPTVELPTPLSPPRLNPQMQRVLQQKAPPAVNTPDKAQPHSSTLNFSPQASSSPWRVQNENILPKTFYFSRSKDQLPSYESDLVVRDKDHQPTVTPQDILPAAMEPVHPRRTSPNHQHSFVRPTAVPPTTAVSSAVFQDIQKSYEQLKATSEMSEKLISAMRKYKSNVHNQTAASLGGDESTAEELIAKFRKYEENMKLTYQKLQQWFQRSQRTLAESMKAIEQTSSVRKTPAQQAVVENFRRNSERFVTMINDLESAMNDSNIENISPAKQVESSGRPPFKDIILSGRNLNDRNRSPLKALDITNVPPPRFSPIKSPLVKASFTSFSGNRTMLQSKSRDRFSKLSLIKPSAVSTETESPAAVLEAAAEKSVIEIADTVVEDHAAAALNETTKQQPEKDLFGFETDDEQEEEAAAGEVPPVEPTPVKITRETLKERLQSVRKLLPASGLIGSSSKSATVPSRLKAPHASKVFNSSQRKGEQSIQDVFSASTPLAEKRKQRGEQDPNISAIRASTGHTVEVEQEKEARKQESPPAAVFFEPELGSTSLASVNRTYSRVPRRNVKRKPNIYLANIGISDGEEEDEEAVSDSDHWTEPETGKRRKKQRAPTQKRKKKKKTVEQSAEFQNFVSEFNSMCDQVNQYQWVVEKPAVQQPV